MSEDFELVFSSSYRNYYDFIGTKSKRKIFSIEDNPYGFGVLDEKFLNKAENKMFNKSDIECWCTSKKLIRKKYSNAKYFSNGINNNFEINLQFLRNKKCIYVGAIDDWFDWSLVNNVFESIFVYSQNQTPGHPKNWLFHCIQRLKYLKVFFYD